MKGNNSGGYMMKKIYIAYTGGTIGMVKGNNGYKPLVGYLSEKMKQMDELKSSEVPEYEIKEYDPLLDSANMVPYNWVKIASDIADNYQDYDGFVVLHGTDTMAYTSSALAFMLRGLSKPVIITGSQIPLQQVRNDARDNLITAMIIAGNCDIPEVCLYFGGKLLRGCRAVKVSADGLHAFDSPDFPPLGIAGVDIKLNKELFLLSPKRKELVFNNIEENTIAATQIFPGISSEVLKNILKPPLKGLVLQTYGVGNIPYNNTNILKELEDAVRRGVIIVACTQNLSGKVQLDTYQAGSVLKEAGVISGFDMSTEAALTKLYYLFSLGLEISDIKEKMQENISGELSQ